MKNIWKGHYKENQRIRLFATIYIKTYQLVDGKTWNSTSSGKRTKVGRMTRYSETPQHKWRFRIKMTLRTILLHFEFSNKTLDLKCATLSIISTWSSCVEMKRIRHLHISHNTPCLPPSFPAPPPKQKYCITFVFNFFWVLQLSLEKLKTKLMQNFGGKQDASDTWEDVELAITHFAPGSSRFRIWRWPAGLKTRTIMSPGKTRRLWEEVTKASCYN